MNVVFSQEMLVSVLRNPRYFPMWCSRLFYSLLANKPLFYSLIMLIILAALGLYIFAGIWLLKRRTKSSVEHFFAQIGAKRPREVSYKETQKSVGADGRKLSNKVRKTKIVDSYPTWGYLCTWYRGRRIAAGIYIKTEGFALDEAAIMDKKNALQNATHLLLTSEGPTVPKRDRIEWRGKKK